MTIGEAIKRYCNDHSISHTRFAEESGVTKGYISMLINGRNPRTGKPPKPSIKSYAGIASAMSMTLDELFSMIDDAPVDLSIRKEPSEDEDLWALRERLRRDPDRRVLLDLAEHGTAKSVRQVAALIDTLRATNPEFYDGDDPA